MEWSEVIRGHSGSLEMLPLGYSIDRTWLPSSILCFCLVAFVRYIKKKCQFYVVSHLYLTPLFAVAVLEFQGLWLEKTVFCTNVRHRFIALSIARAIATNVSLLFWFTSFYSKGHLSGPRAIPPYSFTSPPSTVSATFPFLTRLIYFLAFLSLPILPE